jgi:ubiquinone/menaquinone biosynthesis C-methylase UbiE
MVDETRHTELNKKEWDERANTYDDKNRRAEYLRDTQSKLLFSLGIKKNVHFLDIGCGTGYAMGEAAKLIDFKGQFYGIDLSTKMVEKAKRNFQGRNNFHFLVANAESIPLHDNYFDIIICTNSFHHYLHPDKALSEMHRLLKSGGRIYILDPTADNWIIKILDITMKLKEPEHVKFYSTSEFKRIFKSAGLKYVESSERFKIGSKIHIGEK